ncbi:MAG: hypothetical protein NTY01_01440 [Verrucomicrobia bacterium]|nr:hypothetical protein [Verrucomicrobiota bacterium]
MKPTLQQLSIPGAILARGFWLYVWEVTTADRAKWLYVGRTGDSSSPNAQSPFVRLSQHLAQNTKSNALRHNLENNGVDADACRLFKLISYGPILPEESKMDRHTPARDRMAGLEMGLWDALSSAGYPMLNEVRSRKPLDKPLLREILAAFAPKFPKLKAKRRESQAFNRLW